MEKSVCVGVGVWVCGCVCWGARVAFPVAQTVKNPPATHETWV